MDEGPVRRREVAVTVPGRPGRRPLHHVRLVVGRDQGIQGWRPHAGRLDRPALRHDHVHRFRSDVLRRLVLDLLRNGPVPRPPDPVLDRGSPRRLGHLAAGRHRDGSGLEPAAAEHPDPAAVGHHRDLGAPRAAARRPQGHEDRPGADHRARRHLHHGAGLRVPPHPRAQVLLRRRGRGELGPLRVVLLHGHRLPRLPRPHRDDLPGRLPDPPAAWRHDPPEALRLRSRRLVLALR
ncbi:hypothetical protein SDC9_179768 [bioreactor metagenome]|uniref:Uncharacterized protein n=1 Tax=bioreactor metagenome TaxID=1076179 RepID=A0A645H0S4_9ZZZZ